MRWHTHRAAAGVPQPGAGDAASKTHRLAVRAANGGTFDCSQGFGRDVAAQLPEAAPAPAVAALATRAHRCDECGVIESVRKIDTADDQTGVAVSGRTAAGKQGKIEAEPLGNYAITIRLQDGSMRVIADARPVGELLGQ